MGRAKMGDFEWPWQYSFPPFFTLQPNLDTRLKQVEAWCSLVLAFHRHHQLYSLDVAEIQNSDLFHNKSISRKLNIDSIHLILEELRKKGHIEWKDKQRRSCLLMWRTPEEWGKHIYKWACDNGMSNSVCTLYELANGDDTSNQEFHGLDLEILNKALKTLEVDRKAELMSFDGSEGVKFFG